MKATAVAGGLLLAAALLLPPVGPELRFRWQLWSLRHRADALFECAELAYGKNDLPKARAFAEAALRCRPRQAGARALLQELDFIEKRPAVELAGLPAGAGSLVEIDVTYDRATRAFNEGDWAAAEAGYRRIVEYAKWLPTGVELESRRKLAQDMLDRMAAGR